MLKRCGSLIAALVCSLSLSPSVSASDGTFSTSFSYDDNLIGINANGVLVGCDLKDCDKVLGIQEKIKQVRAFENQDGDWGLFILTDTGKVYLQRYPKDRSGDFPEPERVLIGYNITSIIPSGDHDSYLVVAFLTDDGKIVAYHSRDKKFVTDTSLLLPELTDITDLQFDAFWDSNYPAVAINSKGDLLVFSAYELTNSSLFSQPGTRVEVARSRLPGNKAVVKASIHSVDGRNKDRWMLLALDKEGYLYKSDVKLEANWDLSPDSKHKYILGDWELMYPDVRFTKIDSGYGLSQSGRLYNFGVFQEDSTSSYYPEPPYRMYTPVVYTNIHSTNFTRVLESAQGSSWISSPWSGKAGCTAFTYSELYSASYNCDRSPYDSVIPTYSGRTWSHRSVVVPTKPSVKEQCGTVPVVVVPPETDKVRYERVSVPKGNGTEETVTAYPKLGWVITGQSSWKYNLTPSAPCPTTPVPPPPEDTVVAPPSPTTTTVVAIPTTAIPVVKPTTPAVSATLTGAKPTSAEPSETAPPTTTSSWFKPWYLLAGLVVPFLIPHPAPQPAPVPSSPSTIPSPISSQVPTPTSAVPEVKAENKGKGIVSGVLAYEHRPWLVALGVLLISVCVGAGVVLRRKDND